MFSGDKGVSGETVSGDYGLLSSEERKSIESGNKKGYLKWHDKGRK